MSLAEMRVRPPYLPALVAPPLFLDSVQASAELVVQAEPQAKLVTAAR